MSSERLFFALWPTSAIHTALQQVQARLPPHLPGRLMPPETWHITLAFLGQIEREQRLTLEAAATLVNAPSFSVPLTTFGHWPKPGILWLGPQETPPLLQNLVNDLNTALTETAYQPETRPYRPHLTLMRNVSEDVVLSELPTFEPIMWPVTAFCLVRSVPNQGQTQYTVLKEWALQE